MGDDQGWPLNGLDDIGDGEGLARARDAQEHLVFGASLYPGRQFGNRLRLVALGLEL